MDSDVNKITFDQNQAAENTDREIWRKVPGDYYSDSIHVTEGDGIGLNVGGYVIVLPIEKWHELAKRAGSALVAQTPPTKPVAWRVKDFADGWIYFDSESAAIKEAAATGGLIQALFAGASGTAQTSQPERNRGQ